MKEKIKFFGIGLFLIAFNLILPQQASAYSAIVERNIDGKVKIRVNTITGESNGYKVYLSTNGGAYNYIQLASSETGSPNTDCPGGSGGTYYKPSLSKESTYIFRFDVYTAAGCQTREVLYGTPVSIYSTEIIPAGPPSIGSPTSFNWIVQQNESNSLSASGGVTPYKWSFVNGTNALTTLGLTLSNGGTLSGTPNQTGTFTADIKVTDNNGANGNGDIISLSSAPQQITVYVYDPLTITNLSLTNAYLNKSYNYTLEAEGGVGNYTWTTNMSIPGLTFDTSTHTFSGTPTATGKYSFNVQVNDSDSPENTFTKSFTIFVYKNATWLTPTLNMLMN